MTRVLPVARAMLGVDVRAAVAVVGVIVRYLSVAFAVPAVVALGYGEPVVPFLAAGLLTAAAGLGLERAGGGVRHVGPREGFLIVSLTWMLASASGALPYLLSGEEQLDRPIDALFEAMSGFTTTGATVLVDIPAVDRSLLFWRQFSQWLGGMGIIVLALAVLPRLRVGGRQLFESEAPGPEVEAFTTTIRDTARRLWLVYVVLTALLVLVLLAIYATGADEEMTPFDAFAHALATLPTGGFSPRAQGVIEFGAATQWAVAVFMAIAGANFALLYVTLVRGRPRVMARDDEFRLYVFLLVAASAVLALELWSEGLERGEAALRHGFFQVVSMMTTTGFASADYTEWTALAAVTVIGVMFIGGSAGSTSGSVKVVRHLLIGRMLRRELDQTVHPELVATIRLNRTRVDERTLRAVIVFVLLYIGLFVAGTLALVADAARSGLDLTVFDAIAAAATTLGNVGPGYGFAGPVGSFEPFTDVSTTAMILLMWLGRLELIPVIVLFTRSYWK